uniref:Transmembrane protein n=1 Tax=Panagrellus redivivus TaxID=6233 RepID=A0A7E4UW53_PANRE
MLNYGMCAPGYFDHRDTISVYPIFTAFSLFVKVFVTYIAPGFSLTCYVKVAIALHIDLNDRYWTLFGFVVAGGIISRTGTGFGGREFDAVTTMLFLDFIRVEKCFVGGLGLGHDSFWVGDGRVEDGVVVEAVALDVIDFDLEILGFC